MATTTKLAERDESLTLHLEDKTLSEEGLAAMERLKKEQVAAEITSGP